MFTLFILLSTLSPQSSVLAYTTNITITIPDCPACPPCPSNLPPQSTTTTTTVQPTTTTSTIPPNPTTGQITIPTAHPRIMGDTASYSKLYARWQVAPFDPGTDPFSLALAYRMTRNTTYARTAINWLMAYQIPAGQATTTAIGSDNSRWDGENAILVFDWCWDQMTATERATIIARWNTWLAAIQQQTWGGVGMDMNNYYWSNLRNSLLWGIATFGENTQAQSFLDHALITRWKNSWHPFAAGAGKGGIPHEGPSYGVVMFSYPLIPFEAARSMGRNLWTETPFYTDAVKAMIYFTTPSKVVRKGQTVAKYEVFPFNDCEDNPTGKNVLTDRKYAGDFMTIAANVFDGQPAGGLARAWLDTVQPARSWYAVALDSPISNFQFPISNLPLDYVTPLKAYTRTDWSTNAVAWEITFGKEQRVGHSHKNAGAVQGVGPQGWLCRESAGYGNGLNGGGDSGSPQAHNLLVINGVGPLEPSWQKGNPSQLTTAFPVKVDLTPIYRANTDFAGRVPEAPVSSLVATYSKQGAGLKIDYAITATAACDAVFYLHSEVNPPRWTSTPAAVLDVDEGANGQFRFKVPFKLIVGSNNISVTITPL